MNIDYPNNAQEEKVGKIIEGVPAGICILCRIMTAIDFDQDLHIYEKHRKLLWELPIGGSIDFRIEYVIRLGKVCKL